MSSCAWSRYYGSTYDFLNIYIKQNSFCMTEMNNLVFLFHLHQKIMFHKNIEHTKEKLIESNFYQG